MIPGITSHNTDFAQNNYLTHTRLTNNSYVSNHLKPCSHFSLVTHFQFPLNDDIAFISKFLFSKQKISPYLCIHPTRTYHNYKLYSVQQLFPLPLHSILRKHLGACPSLHKISVSRPHTDLLAMYMQHYSSA